MNFSGKQALAVSISPADVASKMEHGSPFALRLRRILVKALLVVVSVVFGSTTKVVALSTIESLCRLPAAEQEALGTKP